MSSAKPHAENRQATANPLLSQSDIKLRWINVPTPSEGPFRELQTSDIQIAILKEQVATLQSKQKAPTTALEEQNNGLCKRLDLIEKLLLDWQTVAGR